MICVEIVDSKYNKRTILNPVRFSGLGLHSGKSVLMTVKPSQQNTGIIFIRTDVLDDAKNSIKINYNNVTDLTFNTTISNEFGVEVSTVEHLLAALYSLKITDCIVEIDSKETPIMDGSSLIFLNGLKTTMIDEFEDKIPLAVIKKDIKVVDNQSSIEAKTPLYKDQFYIEFEIDFDCKEVGFQKFIFEPSKGDSFGSEISHAKTFALKSDYDYLQSIGYAKGGRLDNGILLEKEKIHNPQALTFKDDFVRHKILDFLGDLYTSGHLFSGRFYCKKSGHKLSNILLKTLFNHKND